MLQLMRKKQLYTKFSKCEFWQEHVVFIGHVVSEDEIMIDPKKVEVVLGWDFPRNETS